MPLYEYRAPSGETVERVLPIELRDSYPNRVTVPARVSVMRGILDPTSVSAAVPRALSQVEDKIGADRLAHESGFSVKTLRKVWANELKAAR